MENYIGSNVRFGDNCKLGHGVVIHDDTIVGDNVVIGDGVVLGRVPVSAKRSTTTKTRHLDPLVIASDVTIGTYVVIYRGAKLATGVFVADSAQIREDCSVGEFTIVGRNVTIENGCSVGARCKLETNAYITAFSTVGDDCFLAPMVTLTNDNFVGRTKERHDLIKGPSLASGARVGANATILPGLSLGEDCLVAAGAVVTKDVPARKIVAGCPAKVLRDVPINQLLENQ